MLDTVRWRPYIRLVSRIGPALLDPPPFSTIVLNPSGRRRWNWSRPNKFDFIDIKDISAYVASILIRNLSDETKKALRVKAAENDRSMTEEARSLIEAGIIQKQRQKNQPKTSNWVDNLLADLRAIGDAELELPSRDEAPPPPDFSGPEFDPRETE